MRRTELGVSHEAIAEAIDGANPKDSLSELAAGAAARGRPGGRPAMPGAQPRGEQVELLRRELEGLRISQLRARADSSLGFSTSPL